MCFAVTRETSALRLWGVPWTCYLVVFTTIIINTMLGIFQKKERHVWCLFVFLLGVSSQQMGAVDNLARTNGYMISCIQYVSTHIRVYMFSICIGYGYVDSMLSKASVRWRKGVASNIHHLSFSPSATFFLHHQSDAVWSTITWAVTIKLLKTFDSPFFFQFLVVKIIFNHSEPFTMMYTGVCEDF